MEYLVEGIRRMWVKSSDEVEGYHLMSNDKENKSLVFVKDSDKCWKTKWIDKSVKVNKPDEPLQTIFK